MKEHDDPIMQSVANDIEKMLAQGQTDLPLGLCFAAARRDESLLKLLLKRGLDPNEKGMNDRTALVYFLHMHLRSIDITNLSTMLICLSFLTPFTSTLCPPMKTKIVLLFF